MNPKAKTEWRRSGERAGASTGPAQATGLATSLLLSSFCHLAPPLVVLPCPHPLGASLSSEKPHAPAAVGVGPSQLECLLAAGALGWAVGAPDSYPPPSPPFYTSAAAFRPVCELLRAVEHVLPFSP